MPKAALLVATALLMAAPLSARSATSALGNEPVTFATVAPILDRYCVECHRDEGPAPFSLRTYSEARRHLQQIVDATRAGLMPPWRAESDFGSFVGQSRPAPGEIAQIESWARGGAQEGSPIAGPRRSFPSGRWRLGQPDLVVSPATPFTVPADGTDLFHVMVIPIPGDAARFVKGIEFDPGNSRVVHHANIRIDRTPNSRLLDARDPASGYDGPLARTALFPEGHFLGWTPGQVAPLLPKGLAWTLAPGSDLVVQVHVRPSGKPEVVRPSIAFYFSSDPPQVPLTMLRLSRQDIDIPPGTSEYIVDDTYRLPVDVEVRAVQPHAHYRAKHVVGTATLPDGTTKRLIDVNDWDFNWQHLYRFERPFTLPAGTLLSMRYTYDNSAANLRNPVAPPARALWGQASADEMGDLWIQVVARNASELVTLNRDFRPKAVREDLRGYEASIARGPQTRSLHDDAAVLAMELGEVDVATTHFSASVTIEPGSATAQFNYGTALAVANRLDQAVQAFESAVAIDPSYVNALLSLGRALVRRGRPAEALTRFARVIEIRPSEPAAYHGLGLARRALGDTSGTVAALREAVRLSPQWPEALMDLSWLLATQPDRTTSEHLEAVRLAERALASGPKTPVALDVLAVACAADGQFTRAISLTEEAMASSPDASLVADLAVRLSGYRNGQPYRP